MSYSFFAGQKVEFIGFPVKTVMMAGEQPVVRVPWCTMGQVYTVLEVHQRDRFRTGKWAGVSLHLGFFDPEHGPVYHHHSGIR